MCGEASAVLPGQLSKAGSSSRGAGPRATRFLSERGGDRLVDLLGPGNQVREKCPGLRVSVEDMLADGDRLAVSTTVHGTPAGDPSSVMEIIRITDGRIAELWGVTNLSWR